MVVGPAPIAMRPPCPSVTVPPVRTVIRKRRGYHHPWAIIISRSHRVCWARRIIGRWRVISGCRGSGDSGADGGSYSNSAQDNSWRRDGNRPGPGLCRPKCHHRQRHGGDTGEFHKCFHIKPLLWTLVLSNHLTFLSHPLFNRAGPAPWRPLHSNRSCHLSIRNEI